MNADSFDEYDDLFADELSALDARLGTGADAVDESSRQPDLPEKLRQELDDCRDCLELLHRARDVERLPGRPDGNAPSGFPCPSHVGRFQILTTVGIGGFGIVFRGIDPIGPRDVAIKIPRWEVLKSPELTQRFQREAAAAARLDHPNIIKIHETRHDDDNIPYIVMPFIVGVTLEERLTSEGAMSPRVAADTVRQLALAVSHAHERGVLHRDLKPQNVLLQNPASQTADIPNDFTPILTDFGLAKVADWPGAETRDGALIGTRRYQAPEQVDARNHEVSERTDVYGLGMILYESLTNHPPFHATSDREMIENICHESPAPFRSHGLKNATDLETICLKCLEKDPRQRYESANELADDLHRVLNGQPISARRISIPARAVKWCRRNPLLTTYLATIVVGVLLVVGMQLASRWRHDERERIAEEQQRIAAAAVANSELNERRAQALEQAVRRKAYAEDVRNAQTSLETGNVNHALTLLDRYRPKGDETDLRDFAWWYLWREIHGASRVLGTHRGGSTAVAVTRTGTIAASGGMDSVIRLWSLPEGALTAELIGHASGPIESLDFSPDGSRLVSTGEDGTVRVWDTNTHRQLFVRDDHAPAARCAIYSPRGDLIASAGDDATIRIWDSETMELLVPLNGHSKRVRDLAFHPTRPLLASGSLEATVRLWDIAQVLSRRTAEELSIRKLEQDFYPRGMAFAPDGNSFIFGSTDASVRQIRVDLGEDGRFRLGDVIAKTTEANRPRAVLWPKDHGWIIGLADSTIRLKVPNEPEQQLESLKGHQGMVRSIAAPKSGRFLISASDDGTVRYWRDIDSGNRLATTRLEEFERDHPERKNLQWKGHYLAADFQQNELSVFRMPERQLERTISKGNLDPFRICASGKLLVVDAQSIRLRCYRVTDGSTIWTTQLPSRALAPVYGDVVIINRDESIAVVVGPHALCVVSFVDGAILATHDHPGEINVATSFQTEGEPLTVVTRTLDGILRFWDIGAGRLLKQLAITATPDWATSATFSDDGCLFADAIPRPPSFTLWRRSDMSKIATIFQPNQPNVDYWMVTQVSFMARSTLLAGPLGHGRLGIWRVPEGDLLLTFEDAGFIGRFAISPDGNQIAIHQKNTIRFIDGRQIAEPAQSRPATPSVRMRR